MLVGFLIKNSEVKKANVLIEKLHTLTKVCNALFIIVIDFETGFDVWVPRGPGAVSGWTQKASRKG